MIIVSQCIIKFAFFTQFDVKTSLSNLEFILLVFTTVFIAAGGYIINDIKDITTDKYNKPNKRIVDVTLDIKTSKKIYYTSTIIGLILGLILAIKVTKPLYVLYFIGISWSLYIYSRYLKTVALIGNLLISVLVGTSLLIVGVFELFPVSTLVNYNNQLAVFYILKDIAVFAFLINLIREIVKDIEDIKGDYAANYITIPTLIGISPTAKITSLLGLSSMFIITLYTLNHIYNTKWALTIVFALIILPLGYISAQLWVATNKKQFSRLSIILKIIMFLGICLIPFISKFINYAF